MMCWSQGKSSIIGHSWIETSKHIYLIWDLCEIFSLFQLYIGLIDFQMQTDVFNIMSKLANKSQFTTSVKQ